MAPKGELVLADDGSNGVVRWESESGALRIVVTSRNPSMPPDPKAAHIDVLHQYYNHSNPELPVEGWITYGTDCYEVPTTEDRLLLQEAQQAIQEIREQVRNGQSG